MGFNTKKQLSSVLGKKKVSAVNAEALAKVFKDNETQANKMSAIEHVALIANARSRSARSRLRTVSARNAGSW